MRRFPSGCVASPHYLASAAGLATLASGGNALDAAIAVNLTLAVVAPYVCGYGGDLFAIVWDGSRLSAYNGSGRAPAAATPQAARKASGARRVPTYGPHAVTVPGAVEAWFALLERFGTRSFADLAATPLRYASEGFVPTTSGASSLRAGTARYKGAGFEEWNATYAHARAGARFTQPAMARTIEALAKHGREPYYRGEIGAAIAGHLRSLGALMGPDDLASHHGDWIEPMSTAYRDVEVVELPPNTQGVTALEALNIAEGLPSTPSPSVRQHGLIEAAKLALVDRNQHVGDPAHMGIDPVVLASKAWADSRRRDVGDGRASKPAPAPGPDGGTTYMCAADSDGMCVSLIQSNFSGFGSGVTVPGWGINLQNRGSSFTYDASHVNAIGPGKRPMHTLIPAMAMRDGRPWLVFGTMGGHGQAQTHLQLLTRIVDDGLDPQQAIDLPRWVVSTTDWSVRAESRFDSSLLDDLRARGHDVRITAPYASAMGHAHAIVVEPDGYGAATDPRTEGAALGL